MKPEVICQDCGKPISHKPHKRCLSCRQKGVLNSNWENFASETTKHAGRKRAQRRFKLGECEKCGQSAFDRHHINGDPLDNRLENIVSLCRRCHMELDGRLSEFIKTRKSPSVQWMCPACRKLYPTYAAAKCCREVPIPTYVS